MSRTIHLIFYLLPKFYLFFYHSSTTKSNSKSIPGSDSYFVGGNRERSVPVEQTGLASFSGRCIEHSGFVKKNQFYSEGPAERRERLAGVAGVSSAAS